MPNVETITNAVPVITHLTPQAVAYDFKQWLGVITAIYLGTEKLIALAWPPIRAEILGVIAYVEKQEGLRGIGRKIIGAKKTPP